MFRSKSVRGSKVDLQRAPKPLKHEADAKFPKVSKLSNSGLIMNILCEGLRQSYLRDPGQETREVHLHLSVHQLSLQQQQAEASQLHTEGRLLRYQ